MNKGRHYGQGSLQVSSVHPYGCRVSCVRSGMTCWQCCGCNLHAPAGSPDWSGHCEWFGSGRWSISERSRSSARQITVRRSVIHGWRREKVHRTYSMYNAAYSSLHTMRSSGRAVHLKPDNFCGSTLSHPDAIQYREIDRETASSMTHEATFPSLLQIDSLCCRRYNRDTSERAWPGRWTDLRRMAQG
jgi:hypothetical protein